MEVEDRLAGISPAVDNHPITPLAETVLVRQFPGENVDASDQVFILSPEIVDPPDVSARNYEDMDGSLGVDIGERDVAIVLVDDLRRDFAGQYAAEETGAHDGDLWSLRR